MIHPTKLRWEYSLLPPPIRPPSSWTEYSISGSFPPPLYKPHLPLQTTTHKQERRRYQQQPMAAALIKAFRASDVPHHLDEVQEAPSAAARRLPAAAEPHAFTVIGHRGSGMNSAADPRLAAVKENSILSFNQAARFPVGFVEFDVQVTTDGSPVIFHDLFILTGREEEEGEGDATISEKRVADLTLDEFLSYGPQRAADAIEKPLLRRSRDGGVSSWRVEADDPLCTLQEAFLRVDSALGFNIELKFDDDLHYREEELERALGVTLQVVLHHAGGRPVIFSTFHPDAAVLMRRLQSTYPVFFLTEAGTETYADPRRNSLDEAIKLCSECGLQGIVSEVRGILIDPSGIERIRGASLALFTYGELNNVPEAVYLQHLMGVDGVIVDLVREITEAVSYPIGGAGEEEGDRPRFSQREISFLLNLIPKLMQHL